MPRSRSDPNAPDGELAASRATGSSAVMAAYYQSEARAKRFEPDLARNARRLNGLAVRRGKVTLLFLLSRPSARERGAVEDCVF